MHRVAAGYEQRVSQKNKRRRSKVVSNKLGFKNALLLVLKSPLTLAKKIFMAAGENPKTATFVVISMAAVGGILGFRSLILNYHEALLPQSVLVNVSSPVVAQQVKRIVNTRLAEAEKKNHTRSTFLNLLTQNLEGVPQLDEYWIRLGLDGRLQINATLQVPILIIESGAGDRFVIGNKLKVIEKNPHEENLPKVMRLVVPDAKFRTQVAVASRSSSDYRRTAGLGKLAAENINMPWLVRQTQFIEVTLSEKKVMEPIEKMMWRPTHGFEVIFKNAPRAILGETMLESKIEKLAEVLADIRSRELPAESIDLNFTDKALIKLSGTPAPSATPVPK